MDIVQNVNMVAARKLDDFELRDQASLMRWLSEIVLNQVRDANRHVSRGKRDVDREVAMHFGEGSDESVGLPRFQGASDDPLPEEDAWRRELREIVDDSMTKLPDDYREVILQRDYYGAEWDEVAGAHRQAERPRGAGVPPPGVDQAAPDRAAAVERAALEPAERSCARRIGFGSGPGCSNGGAVYLRCMPARTEDESAFEEPGSRAEDLFESFLAAQARGDAPDFQSFLAQHPELADELIRVRDLEEAMRRLLPGGGGLRGFARGACACRLRVGRQILAFRSQANVRRGAGAADDCWTRCARAVRAPVATK